MQEQCKHFQSRTYASGEVARMCELDLAPEAPWRCPDDCPAFDRPTEEPAGFNASSIELLDEAEAIVNAVVPSVLDEVQRQRDADERRRPGRSPRGAVGDGWQRIRGRFKRR